MNAQQAHIVQKMTTVAQRLDEAVNDGIVFTYDQSVELQKQLNLITQSLKDIEVR